MSTAFKVLLASIIFISLLVAWWLLSPLFLTREVNESLEDALSSSPDQASPPDTQNLNSSGTTSTNNTPPTRPSANNPTTTPRPQTIASGTFTGQANHDATGTAQLIRAGDSHIIRFAEDFSITNGPDLFVHLGKDGSYDEAARLDRLKGNRGSQNYVVPNSIDISQYNEVWVWCRAFSVPFGKAPLN